MADPFPLRGVVEGFYGVFYTHGQRNALIDWLSQHGFNRYVYAPKNDRYHRDDWREPYPPQTLARLIDSARRAARQGVSFDMGLSPISATSPDQVHAIWAKFAPFLPAGVRAFSLLFDDMRDGTEALHAAIANELARWLAVHGATLTVCPTAYHGPPFPESLGRLASDLDETVGLYYTGPEIVSERISAADVAAFAAVARRRPILWENYPVNDLHMQGRLHLGPMTGRGPDLAGAVGGVVINPMLQGEATKIPLLSWAEYLRDPLTYEPRAAWDRAIVLVAGWASAPSLRRVAEHMLDEDGLERVVARARAGDERAWDWLARAERSLNEASYHLLYAMENEQLREDLRPWLVGLRARLGAAREVIRQQSLLGRPLDETPALDLGGGWLSALLAGAAE